MKRASEQEALLDSLESALALLQAHPTTPLDDPAAADPLPSLLQQCEALIQGDQTPILRSIHHLAGTGGTLLSKCLAAQPNVVLLSEIDPLSLIGLKLSKPVFSPRSVIQQLRYSQRGNSDALVIDLFKAEVTRLRDRLAERGQVLVLRDHAHSHYCTGPSVAPRASLHQTLAEIGPTRSIVTVRHPADSFLSLSAQPNWQHFSPATLEEYCRRYLAFLNDHAALPLYRYEDFVAAPEQVTAAMCADLALGYVAGALALRDAFPLSGDSGRSGPEIAARPRRPVPESLLEQSRTEAYVTLCRRLGYDAELD